MAIEPTSIGKIAMHQIRGTGMALSPIEMIKVYAFLTIRDRR
jgi:hypothetical protein